MSNKLYLEIKEQLDELYQERRNIEKALAQLEQKREYLMGSLRLVTIEIQELEKEK